MLEARAHQEDVVTSSWVPAPPRMSERRSSNYTFTHPTDRVYKSELTIAPTNSISTKVSETDVLDSCFNVLYRILLISVTNAAVSSVGKQTMTLNSTIEFIILTVFHVRFVVSIWV